MNPEKQGRLGTDVIIAVGISYFGYFASFISSIVIARLLGAEGKGLYSLFIETSFGIYLFSALGIGNGQIYETMRNPELMKHFIFNGIVFSATIGIGSASIYYLCGAIFHFKNVTLLSTGIVVAGILAVPLISFETYQRQFLLANRSYRLAKINGAVVAIVPMVFYLILYALKAATISSIIYAFVLGLFLCIVGFQWVISRFYPVIEGFSAHLARMAFSFGIWQYFGDLSFFLIRRLDFFFVFAILGKSGLGIYSVAVAMAEITSRITHEIGTVLFPEFSSGKIANGRAAPIMRKTILSIVLIAAGLGLLSRPLILVFFGNEFRAAITAFQILLIGNIALSIVDVAWNYVMATGNPKPGIVFFLAGAGIDVILNLLLTRRYNVIGASVAATASYWVSAVFFLRKLCIKERCSLREAVIIKLADIKEIIASAKRVPKVLLKRA